MELCVLLGPGRGRRQYQDPESVVLLVVAECWYVLGVVGACYSKVDPPSANACSVEQLLEGREGLPCPSPSFSHGVHAIGLVSGGFNFIILYKLGEVKRVGDESQSLK
jgi:hypothetical protein